MIKQTEEAICPDLPVIPEYTVTITDHGAVGDGVYDNTQAFHQAIEACAKAGGRWSSLPGSGTPVRCPCRAGLSFTPLPVRLLCSASNSKLIRSGCPP